ncbi:hypothetical protein DPEC_G00151570 [Dallia pectoralis]|uniref:Uncharacterized protein n=1 Tax=Dallia pectoralis TaxID=75939 RepID=A0ACC2GJ13_DALPE|nr:hypothetical protein DPEC_G00151570 [Dallia pectoralis]
MMDEIQYNVLKVRNHNKTRSRTHGVTQNQGEAAYRTKLHTPTIIVKKIEALQEVLEKLKNKQIPLSEKKLSWLPSCDAGEQCAVRKGARVGTLCGCPRGTTCNFYVLKCL